MPNERSNYLLRPATFMLYLFPPVLIIGNYLFFQFTVTIAGSKNGYLLGMICYWLIWCTLPFLLFVSRINRKLLFRLTKISWWQILLLIVPVILAFSFGPFKNRIGDVSPLIIILSLIYATVNALSEELLWRGIYYDHHQANFFYAVIVPSAWFGLWHYAPLSIQPASASNFYFIISAMGLGLCWATVTFFTRSIFWSFISHLLVDFSGIGALYFFK